MRPTKSINYSFTPNTPEIEKESRKAHRVSTKTKRYSNGSRAPKRMYVSPSDKAQQQVHVGSSKRSREEAERLLSAALRAL